MRIVIASSNKGKLKEIQEILGKDYQLVTKADLNLDDFDVEEDGQSLEENAFKKANALYELIKEAVLADDTGLFVQALDGGPGVYTARYAGDECDPEKNNNKMLEELKEIDNLEDRRAYFKTVMCFISNEGKVEYIQAIMDGYIAFEKSGDKGFGYDPIFIPEGYNKTIASLDPAIKNTISHRARALANLKAHLETK